MAEDFIHPADILVRDAAGFSDFLLEPIYDRRNGCNLRTNRLESNAFAQFEIPSLVHFPHAAATEEMQDSKASSDKLSNAQRLGCWGFDTVRREHCGSSLQRWVRCFLEALSTCRCERTVRSLRNLRVRPNLLAGHG